MPGDKLRVSHMLQHSEPRPPDIHGNLGAEVGTSSAVLISGLSVMPSVSGTLARTQATVPPALC